MRMAWKCGAVGLALATVLGGAAVAFHSGERPATPRADEKPIPTTPRDVSVSLEWAVPADLKVGQPATITLTARNTSPQPAQKVVVQLRVPKAAALTDPKPAAKVVEGIYLWELGTLEPKEAKSMTYTLTTTARGDTGCQAWVTFTGTAGINLFAWEPKLEATIVAPKSVGIGEAIPVTYAVNNVGNTKIDGIKIELRRSAEQSAGPLFKHVFSNDASNSPLGEQAATLTPGTGDSWSAKDKAFVRADFVYELTVTGADGTKATAKAKVHVTAPKFEVKLTGPAARTVNQKGVYHVEVKNTGDQAAKNLRLRVKIPAGLTVAAYEPAVFDPVNRELVWSNPAGVSAQGEPIAVGRFEATPTVPGRFTFDANVRDATDTQGGDECTTVAEGVSALRMELVDSVDPLLKGNETAYEIRVTNTGTKSDSNVVISCPIPAALKLASVNGPTGHTVENLNGITLVKFEPIRELAPKTEAVFRIVVKAVTTGDVRFQARLTSANLTTSVVKEESTRIYGE